MTPIDAPHPHSFYVCTEKKEKKKKEKARAAGAAAPDCVAKNREVTKQR